jgi:hypothetical protein
MAETITNAHPPASLILLIEQQSVMAPSREIQALCDELLRRYGKAVQAILLYGSCLRSGDAFDGLVDLYVIVDNYGTTYRDRTLILLNRLLPPNVFYMEQPFEGRVVRAKYAVLSLRDLQQGTSKRWFHSYLWGRFAQPSALVYARSDGVNSQVATALAQAVVTFLGRVLPQVPTCFDAAELWQRGLALSYRSELRAEQPERAIHLFETFKDHYEALTPTAIAAVPYAIEIETDSPPIRYRAKLPRRIRHFNHLTWGVRRVQGKALSLLRLIKALFTFKGGIDYLAWKLERHSGVRIEVTPKLRRHPLLFSWGLMWRLYRRGVFR